MDWTVTDADECAALKSCDQNCKKCVDSFSYSSNSEGICFTAALTEAGCATVNGYFDSISGACKLDLTSAASCKDTTFNQIPVSPTWTTCGSFSFGTCDGNEDNFGDDGVLLWAATELSCINYEWAQCDSEVECEAAGELMQDF